MTGGGSRGRRRRRRWRRGRRLLRRGCGRRGLEKDDFIGAQVEDLGSRAAHGISRRLHLKEWFVVLKVVGREEARERLAGWCAGPPRCKAGVVGPRPPKANRSNVVNRGPSHAKVECRLDRHMMLQAAPRRHLWSFRPGTCWSEFLHTRQGAAAARRGGSGWCGVGRHGEGRRLRLIRWNSRGRWGWGREQGRHGGAAGGESGWGTRAGGWRGCLRLIGGNAWRKCGGRGRGRKRAWGRRWRRRLRFVRRGSWWIRWGGGVRSWEMPLEMAGVLAVDRRECLVEMRGKGWGH